MAEPTCPVCDTELDGAPVACPKCGFPTVFRAEAVEALREKDPFVRPAGAAPPPRRSPSRSAANRTSTEADKLAEDLEKTSLLLNRLGESPDALSQEVRSAARAQLAGRPDESVRLLRAATAHASDAVYASFDRRLKDLNARQSALAKDGFGNAIEGTSKPVEKALADGRFAEAVDLLSESERRVARIVEDLESLRAPVREIDEMIAILDRAGVDLPGERRRAEEIRAALLAPGTPRAELARLSERANELRGALREKVPASLYRELEQHEIALRPYPDDHPTAAEARAAHARALDHLEGGRLPDAASELASLRAAIERLEPAARPRVEHGGDVPVEDSEPLEVTVPELVQTARLLAARVRALEPGSELAFEAARQIRQATELLRARRLDEAAATLAQLMQSLDRAELATERSALP